jgi:IclR family mhp operon transcriptional activator
MTGPAAEPIRPIRALLRGLEALRSLNRGEGLTVTEVADNARLPRTTAYRILETLRTGGYVIRDEIDDRYRPTMAVKGLADGVEDEAWLREHAWPVMQALCKKLLWPIGLTTLKSGQMILRAATDRMSPLALERYAPGERYQLARSACGAAYLSALSHEEAEEILAGAGVTGAARESALTAAAEARRQGAVSLDLSAVQGECTLATVLTDAEGRPYAALNLRYIKSAMPAHRALAELAPALKAAAAEIMAARDRAAATAAAKPAVAAARVAARN